MVTHLVFSRLGCAIATSRLPAGSLDFRFWILDFGNPKLDFRFWILDFGFWILG
jgi:hypothetical protein